MTTDIQRMTIEALLFHVEHKMLESPHHAGIARRWARQIVDSGNDRVLQRIRGMCGIPDPAEACRLILKYTECVNKKQDD